MAIFEPDRLLLPFMDNARIKGKRIGRPSITVDNLPPKFLQYYPVYKRGELNVSDFARILHCSRTTLYSYIKLYEANP
jgi:hypothetical protein